MATQYNTGTFTFPTHNSSWALHSVLRLVQELNLADPTHTSRIITLLGGGGPTTQDLTTEQVTEIRQYLTPVLTAFPRIQTHYFEEACQALDSLAHFYGWGPERDIKAECIC